MDIGFHTLRKIQLNWLLNLCNRVRRRVVVEIGGKTVEGGASSAEKKAMGVDGRFWPLSSCDMAPMIVQRCWWLSCV